MVSAFERIMLEMMQNPPDPNEPLPTSNLPVTMYGATIPFHILAWTAVLWRLYTRFKIVREPGWDDFFVILAALFNLVSMITFLESIRHGMGKHLLSIDPSILKTCFKWLYVQGASYYTTTALIKISLLCQYLRIFRIGFLRPTCIVLLGIVTVWGVAFSFMAWFPCFPVSGFWDRMQQPPPKCYGFGFADLAGATAAFVGFAATNMFLDLVIFLIPMAEYFKPNLRRKEVLAMTGLFLLGSIVVLMSILRLWTAAKHNANDVSTFDFTWWYPLTLIISCIEVDFAIMCASMPIFWPAIVESLSQISAIFVTKEIHVTSHQRLDEDPDIEMDRPTSFKSNSSQEGLTKVSELTKADSLTRAHVTGTIPTKIEVGVDKKGHAWL
ncbi:hypothetical protein EJ04DRAFT_67926 [Polyplosphaeria fusca]|uniref:Rhodopsin domain-containing protein n=1 Tax=Polyplosphaeria fusca TaxID=682080 RepID=A0A9P4R7U4_9PLEO|nr:hypothetical protein EJ04DRAFT_67926 [Polyplosphaeria fusca]